MGVAKYRRSKGVYYRASERIENFQFVPSFGATQAFGWWHSLTRNYTPSHEAS
jgi:hypothetical protein